MKFVSRRRVLRNGVLGVACACVAPALAYAAESPTGKYMCPPCGCSADGKEFDAAGDCPACGMPLIAQPAAPKDPAPQPPKAGERDGGLTGSSRA